MVPLWLFLLPQSQENNIFIDHTPVVVENLRDASKQFEELGFLIKPGHEHENGINNNHIKFRDSTSIEIVEISESRDDITKSYLEHLSNGEGGTYLALRISSIDEMNKKLKKANIDHKITKLKSFTYITFPNEKGMNQIFLIYYNFRNDSDGFTFHPNKSNGIKEVWIQGDSTTISLLDALGIEVTDHKNKSTAISLDAFKTIEK